MSKKLYAENGHEIKEGDVLTDFRGDRWTVDSIGRYTEGSAGKVSVRPEGEADAMTRVFYVTVFDLVWRDSE